jgi:N-acetyl-gamma-glutamylphosphate reductase
MVFSSAFNADVDVLFLCLGHGNSKAFLETHTFSDHTKIIDLSNDFRLEKDNSFHRKTFTYGLPELQNKAIKKAKYIANPGCFATAIQLALLPLAKADLIGLPYQIIVGPNGIKDQVYDLKNRKSGETHKLSYSELLNFFNSKSI